jgi:glucose/arabinose dehydrogenase
MSALVLVPAKPAQAASYVTGFSEEVAASGFGFDVTNVDWRADGSMLVAQKGGKVTLVKNGVKSTFVDIGPFINNDLPGTNNVQGDRGLLGIEVDSDGQWLYLLFTQNNNWPGDQNKTAKLIKVPITGDTANANQAVILLGKDATYNTFSCEDLAVTADCIASDATSHTIGSVRQAPDGSLYVSTGDGARFDDGYADPRALRSLNLDSLAGKVLRIDRNGKGLADNPFYNGNNSANRSKVWASGFRNPFRMNLQPGTNTPVLGDTMWNSTEEQNYVKKGGNYGWPCYEGTPKQTIYASDPATKPACDALYAQGAAAVQKPMYEYDRNGIGSAAIGGAFYTGTRYPAQYQGAWFFGDYAQEWLKYLKVDGTGNVTTPATSFATNIPVYVGMQMGPDGYLYYASLTTGNIYRIVYNGGGQGGGCSAGQFTGSYYSGKTPGGTPLATVCSADVNNNWAYGAPAAGVPADNFSAIYTADRTFEDATYEFTLRSDDGSRLYIDDQPVPALDHWVDQGATTYKAPVKLTAGTHKIRLDYYEATGTAEVSLSWAKSAQNAPTATIATPADGAKINPGTTVNFSGSATDAEDGALAASRLQWTTAIQHCADAALTDCHYHPLNTYTGTAGGSFVFPDHGPNEIYYVELSLKATDSSGLSTTKLHKLYPDQPSTTGPCAAGQFKADYFAGKTLSGTAIATGCTDTVAYDWGYGSPEAAVPADNFSARYTATRTFAAGTYRFTLASDDGSRLLIDGQPVAGLNQWSDHSLNTVTADVTLTAAAHTITLEYYEGTGKAQLNLSYANAAQAPLPNPAAGWKGEYWNTPTAGAAPAFPTTAATYTRTDPAIDFAWDYGAPAPAINADKFMTRWSGQINFPAAGTYKVSTVADDGVRVKVKGATVLDEWRDQGPATREATFTVAAAGLSDVVVEYYEGTGTATAKVSLIPTSTTAPPPPPPPTSGCATGQFKADYFTGTNLTGTAVATACTDNIDYDWQYNSPAAAVPADNFSARYTATRSFTAGTRTITVEGDDGVRLYIDGQLVINGWKDQGTTTYRANHNFTAGNHTLVLEYYEKTGTASVMLDIAAQSTTVIGAPAGGWKGDYWNVPAAGSQPAFPATAPTLTRQDAAINFRWDYGSPAATINADKFMARWTGTLNLAAGTYQIKTTADDGIRVKVNGATVLDNWVDQGPTVTTRTFTVAASGNQAFVIEYYENTGTATSIFELSKL